MRKNLRDDHDSRDSSGATVQAPKAIGWPVLLAALAVVLALVVWAGSAIVQAADEPPKQPGSSPEDSATTQESVSPTAEATAQNSPAPRNGKTVTLTATSKGPASLTYGDSRNSQFETFDGTWTTTFQLHDRVDVAHLKVISSDQGNQDTVSCEITHNGNRAAHKKATGSPASVSCRALSKEMH